MVMGAANSCVDFEKLFSRLQFIMKHHLDVHYISHIIDDFVCFFAF